MLNIFKMSLEKYIVILFGVLIPFNYLGRGLFNIDLALILVLFIIYLIKNKIDLVFDYKKMTFIYIVILFYILALGINLINPTEDSFKNIKLILILTSFLFISAYIFKISKFRDDNYIFFEKILFYAVSIVSIIVLISFLIDINIIQTINKRIVYDFNHASFHSKQNLIAICIAFLINFYVNNKNKFNLSLLIITYIATFIAQGRTAIIVICVGTVVYIIYDMYIKGKFTLKYNLIISSLLFVTIFLLLYISGSTIDNLTIHTSARYDGWITYIDLILKENSYFGYGLQGGLVVFKSDILAFKHPHNAYIEALFSLGFIGFVLLLSITVGYIIYSFKLNEKKYNKHLIFSLLCSVLVMEQGIGTIWGTNFVLSVLFLIYLSLNDRIIDKDSIIRKDKVV